MKLITDCHDHQTKPQPQTCDWGLRLLFLLFASFVRVGTLGMAPSLSAHGQFGVSADPFILDTIMPSRADSFGNFCVGRCWPCEI